jgi:ParB-like chromosome segregation protein Spo0J
MSEKGREFHPVADLFPLLEGAAFEELVADIRKNGLREPILCDAQDRIVDGRNRYRACLAAEVEPRFERAPEEGAALTEMALSRNLRRRHLDESQRALVAARLVKLWEKQGVRAMGRPRKSLADLQDFSGGELRAQAAETINVSPRLVHCAMRLLRGGCEELIAAVGARKLKVSTAAALAGLPATEQKRVVAAGAKEAARKVRELRGGKGEAEGRPEEARPSPGVFGVVGVKASGMPPEVAVAGREEGGDPEGVVLLWVPARGLGEAVEALKGRGFRWVGGEMETGPGESV